jgi:hypothetical protein
MATQRETPLEPSLIGQGRKALRRRKAASRGIARGCRVLRSARHPGECSGPQRCRGHGCRTRRSMSVVRTRADVLRSSSHRGKQRMARTFEGRPADARTSNGSLHLPSE